MVETKLTDNTDMTFSILVPVYNVEPYIRRCLDSLLVQDIDDYEIILVDDGSTDNSGAICDEYAAAENRISVIHQENAGISVARNVGVAAAKGKYLVFVDSDDALKENVLLEMKTHVLASDADVVTGGVQKFRGGVGKIYTYDLSRVKRNMGGRSDGKESPPKTLMTGEEFLTYYLLNLDLYQPVWLYMWKRSFLCENGLLFRPGILHEDLDFTPRAILKAKSVLCSSIIHYKYYIREGSITHQKDKKLNITHIMETLNRLKREFSALPDSELKNLLYGFLADQWLAVGYVINRIWAVPLREMICRLRENRALMGLFDPTGLAYFRRSKATIRLFQFSPVLCCIALAVYRRLNVKNIE